MSGNTNETIKFLRCWMWSVWRPESATHIVVRGRISPKPYMYDSQKKLMSPLKLKNFRWGSKYSQSNKIMKIKSKFDYIITNIILLITLIYMICRLMNK